jgi:type IV secretory pathway TraG/TraD family ATPase VirD4
LRQIQARGETAIVVDPEQEFIREFYNEQRGDWLLNPSDGRCPLPSLWDELAEEGDYLALAHSLLPDLTNSTRGVDLFFRESARTGLVALLTKITTRNPLDLCAAIMGPPQVLDALVAGTDAAPLLDKDAHQQRAGILATLQLAAKALRFLPTQASRQWSAREWVQKKEGWVFLSFRANDREAVLPLISMWFDCLLRRLLDTPLDPHATTWVVIDELAALQRLPHLQDLFVRGRKHGVAVIAGFQAYTQLEEIYGEKAASTMLAMPATKLLLRTGDPHTARWCSQVISNREVVRGQESLSAGEEDGRNTMSRTMQRKEEAAVLAAEFLQLPALHGFLSTSQGVTKVRVPVMPLQAKQPGFVPRVSAPVPPPPAVKSNTNGTPRKKERSM